VGRWFQDGRLTLPDHVSFDGMTFDSFLSRRLDEHRRGSHDHRLFLWSLWLLHEGHHATAP